MNEPREDRSMTLDGGTLSTWDAVAMAIAVLSPAAAMAYNATGAALFGGSSTPLAFLLAGVACLCLAFVVVSFTRRMVSAGYLYTYCSKVLGPSGGFLVGWLYFFGFFCFVPMTVSGVGGFGRELLRAQFGAQLPDWSWFAIFLACMVAAVALNVVGAEVSARTQLAPGVATILVVAAVSLLITAAGGHSGHTSAPFTLRHWPYQAVPYLVAVWILLGVAVLCWLRRSAPQRIRQIGSIMGESGDGPPVRLAGVSAAKVS